MAGGIFMSALKPFNETQVNKASKLPGVYVIYKQGTPVYVGRSSRSIRNRLRAHQSGKGNWFVKLIRSSPETSFEYCTTMSPEQAEAQLILGLKTKEYGNYRCETDPALKHIQDAVQQPLKDAAQQPLTK